MKNWLMLFGQILLAVFVVVFVAVGAAKLLLWADDMFGMAGGLAVLSVIVAACIATVVHGMKEWGW